MFVEKLREEVKGTLTKLSSLVIGDARVKVYNIYENGTVRINQCKLLFR